MISHFYNFHNILKLQITRQKKSIFDEFLNNTFSYYEVSDISNPDLFVFIGDFKPDLKNCFIVDGRYYIKKDYIFYQNSYKYAHWKVEIKGLESDKTNVSINSNKVGRIVFPGETIYSLIRYKLALKGYPLIHGSGVGINDKGYVFSARGGTGKTITAINLVKRGFDYYSDDSLILGEGKIFSFIVPFNLRFTYDVEKLLGIEFTNRTRCELFWKKILYYLTLKRISLFTTIKAKDIFKEAIKEDGRIDKFFVLTQGPEFMIKDNLKKEEMVKKIFLNIWFESPELIAMQYAYSFVYPKSLVANFWENMNNLISKNIDRLKYYEVIIPPKYTKDIFDRFFNQTIAK
ncbi:MAG: hypothetical protein AB1472_01240 [Candidatus Omnitrophota bacterium]